MLEHILLGISLWANLLLIAAVMVMKWGQREEPAEKPIDKLEVSSLIEKLAADLPEFKTTATPGYDEFLRRLVGWANSGIGSKKAHMRRMSLRLGFGPTYVERIVYGMRRPSLEAADTIMAGLGWADSDRERVSALLAKELSAPVAKSPGHRFNRD